MRLGDYADGAWMFVATCGTCGRQTRVDPAEVLTHPRTHPHMRVAELALHLRCRDCRHRTARIDPVGGEFVGIRHRSIFGSREPGVPRDVVAMA